MDTRQQPAVNDQWDRDDDWGPPLDSGGRPPRRRRGRRVVAVLLVVLLLLVGWGAALAWHLDSSIERIDVPGRTARTGARVNVLVIGSDSREGLSDEQRDELRTGDAVGNRTDSIMLLSVAGRDASLTSFPRDLWVTRCDGSQGRINAALAIDGPGCLVDTVESLGDLPVHHWIEVDFGGFQGLVDAVGGVRICVDKALDDPLAGIDLEPGCQRLDGATALGYVRTRKLDSDLERIARQQEFMAALATRLAQPATLVNPVRAWETTGAVGGALRADRDLGLAEYLRLGWGGRSIAGGDLATATVPGTPATIGGAAVLEPDLAAAEELFAPLRQSAPSAEDGDQVELPERAEVTVTVLNGGSVAGAAQGTADALAALGYGIDGVDNAESTPETTVVASPEGEGAARLLVSDLPVAAEVDTSGTIGERTLSGNEVVLVLGDDLDPAELSSDTTG